MNYFFANDRPRAESVAEEIKAYRDAVHTAGLRVDSQVLHKSGAVVVFKQLWNLVHALRN